MGAPDYESHRVASDYLLFHYGSAADQLPWPDGPVDALEFPARCAELVLRHAAPGLRARALDLGCATGRATFELARGFYSVPGVDFAKTLVPTSNALRVAGRLQVTRVDEGAVLTPVFVHVPADIDRGRVSFRRGDACAPDPADAPYDAVLMANLICRVADPAACLAARTQIGSATPDQIAAMVADGRDRGLADRAWITGNRRRADLATERLLGRARELAG